MSWNLTARLNPELLRSVRVSLPRRRALFVMGLTLVVLAAGGWLLWTKTEPWPDYYKQNEGRALTPDQLWAEHLLSFGREAFGALTVVLFALFFLLGPAMAGLSFVQERLRGTAIFQQMSLLSPVRLAAGKFWGSGVLAFFVAALLVPCALVAAFVGEINPLLVLRLYLFMLIGGLCWQAVGLYVSAALSGPAEKPLRGGLLVGPLVAVGAGISALILQQFFTVDYETLMLASDRHSYDYEHQYWIEQGHYWWYLYGARVPAWLVILGVTAFAGLWAFAGAVRRIKVWQLIPVSPRAAWVFFAGAEALLVGLLWGRYPDDSEPIERLQAYLLLNGAALALLAGGSALTRDRLREWWSAERDPLALFRRAEIKGTLQTFLFALCVAEAGLLALWLSYHVDPLGRPGGYQIATQFLPLAFACAATAVALAAFAQFCAMFRFRVGGWAGVVLAAIFYLFMAAAGALFEPVNNTPALVNPVVYAELLTKGDYYVDSTYRTETQPIYAESETGPLFRGNERVRPLSYSVAARPAYDLAETRTRGLLAEGGLALLCLALAGWKWRRTRAEMAEASESVPA
jgi:hypothetical protein